MNNYFSILFSRQHIIHPFTIPIPQTQGDQKQSHSLKIQKVIAVLAMGVLGGLSSLRLQYAGIGVGLVTFYLTSALFKHQEVKKCQAVWSNTNDKDQGQQTTVEQKKEEPSKKGKLDDSKKEQSLPKDLQEEENKSQDSQKEKQILNLTQDSSSTTKKLSDTIDTGKSKQNSHEVKKQEVEEGKIVMIDLTQPTFGLHSPTTDKRPVINPDQKESSIKDALQIKTEKTLGKVEKKEEDICQNQENKESDQTNLHGIKIIQQDVKILEDEVLESEGLDSENGVLEDDNDSSLSESEDENGGSGEISEELTDKQVKLDLVATLGQEQSLEDAMLEHQERVKKLEEDSNKKVKFSLDAKLDQELSPVEAMLEHQERVRQLEEDSRRVEEKLKKVLDEFLSTEHTFLSNATQITKIFEKINQSNPQEKFVQKYHALLQQSLPSMKDFYKKFEQLSKDPDLPTSQSKAAHLGLLVKDSNPYYDALASLTLLQEEFNKWDDQNNYEMFVKKESFSQDIITNLETKYSPIIFFQRIGRHKLLVADLIGKKATEYSVIEAFKLLEEKIEKSNEVMKTFKDIEISEELRKQLDGINSEKSKNNKNLQEKVVKDFIKHKLYQYPEHQLNQSILEIYSSRFQKYLAEWIKYIEENKRKSTDQVQSKTTVTESKTKLKQHFDYFQTQPSFVQWKELSTEVLSNQPLSYTKLEDLLKGPLTLDFVLCLTQLLKIMKESKDFESKRNSEVVSLLKSKIKENFTKISSLSSDGKKLKSIQSLIKELEKKKR